MNGLAELQRAFQSAVLDGAQLVAQSVAASEHAAAEERIGVYRDAYRLRLREGLAANYPRLRQLLGEDAFASIADAYIDAHPSRNASIRWFGDRLGGELQRVFATRPWLGELAQWEWAIAYAFDAKNARRVSMPLLGEVASDAWPTLRFTFHPSVQCLQMSTNAPALFKALTEDSQPPEPAAAAATTWLIWRDDLTTRFRSMAGSEAAALATLMRGDSFETMCTDLCAWYAEDEVAQHAVILLRAWIEAGMVRDFFSTPTDA